MGFQFKDWVRCPECDEREQVKAITFKTDIVFECYECGMISEFTFGEDIPLQNLDTDAMADIADEQTGD